MKRLRRAAAVLAIGLAGGLTGWLAGEPPATAAAAPVSPGAPPIGEAEAAAMLRDLAPPIAACVARRDTAHAAFPGCIDWHSSVHGTWALIAIMRATGSAEYDDLVRARLAPANIEGERALLARHPGFEMPYGRAWFLRLAIDHQARFADGALMPMAAEVADGLAGWLAAVPPDPWRGSYGSQAWAVLNLLDWTDEHGFKADRERARALGRRLVGRAEGPCPVARERGHFMAVCTTLAAVAARVLPAEELAPWLSRLFDGVALVPVERPVNAHHNGLNFSRAWGLWELWRATGDPRWRNLYVAHLRASHDRPEQWRGDYATVGHWVGQFGVYALQPLFGPARGR